MNIENNNIVNINLKNEEVKGEITKRNIKTLNVSMKLLNDLKPELTFKGSDFSYVEKVELVGSSIKYEPFKERTEEKFESLVFEVNPKQEQEETWKQDPWGKGIWNNEDKTLILDKKFTRPGIYTGVIRIKKEYEEKLEEYVVSFKKLPSDFISYDDLKITAGKLVIKDLHVSDGYKCVRIDNLDEVIIECNNSKVSIKCNDPSCKAKYIKDLDSEYEFSKNSLVTEEISEGVQTAETPRKRKVIEVNLLELAKFGRLKPSDKITIKVKYFDIYEVSTEILLVEEEIYLDEKNVFLTNEPSAVVSDYLQRVYGDSSLNGSLSSFIANSTVSGTIKFGTYSVAEFSQTFGSDSSILGGADLYVHKRENQNTLDIFVNNPVFNKGRSKTKKSGKYKPDRLSKRNPVLDTSVSNFVYTHQLSSYTLSSTGKGTPTGATGLIGQYFFQVESSAPKLYFDATKYLNIGTTTSNIYFTYSTAMLLKDQKEKEKLLKYIREELKKKEPMPIEVMEVTEKGEEDKVSKLTPTTPINLPTGFFGQWGISPVKLELDSKNFNHGYNPLVVSFTSDVKKDGEAIKTAISTISYGNFLSYIKSVNTPTTVKTTLLIPVDKIEGYMIYPKVVQISSNNYKFIFENIKKVFPKLENNNKMNFYLEFAGESFKIEDSDSNNIEFNVKTNKQFINDEKWIFKYEDKVISEGIYGIPKVEVVTLSEFNIEDIQVQEIAENTEKNLFKIEPKFKDLQGKVTVKKSSKTTENNSPTVGESSDESEAQIPPQFLSEESKEKLEEVNMNSANLQDLDKTIIVNLEIKEDEKQEGSDESKEDRPQVLEDTVAEEKNDVQDTILPSIGAETTTHQVESSQPSTSVPSAPAPAPAPAGTDLVELVPAKPRTKSTKKYQGVYSAGVIVEKLDFELNLSHNIILENAIEVIVTPKFYNGFDKNTVLYANIYYKKHGKDLWSKNKKLPITLNKDKIGKVNINNLDYNAKYDVVAAYNYELKLSTGFVEKRVMYSPITIVETLPKIIVPEDNGSIVSPNNKPTKPNENTQNADGIIDVNGEVEGVISGGDKIEFKIPDNLEVDSNKTPKATSFSYKDSKGKVVQQKKEDFENVKVKFEGDKLKVEGLVPGKQYDKLELKYVDKDGKIQTLQLKNIKIEPEKESEKYLANVYTKMFNRPADEKGYHYHLNSLENKKVSIRDFLMNTITQKEFIEENKSQESKIEALYGAIVGRDADKEGMAFWKSEYEKVVSQGKSDLEAVKILASKMVNEGELKELADKMDLKY